MIDQVGIIYAMGSRLVYVQTISIELMGMVLEKKDLASISFKLFHKKTM